MIGARRIFGLWSLFLLQLVCVLFLLGEAVVDLFALDQGFTTRDSDTLEYAVVMALLFGLVFSGLEIRRMLGRQARMEAQLKVASGAFAELLNEHFDGWGLTPSERDVALMAIKGLSIADIARLRQTKEGTIKAQSNAIYRKAGVSGRPQLLSLFIEELMAENLIDPAAATGLERTPAG